MPFSKLIGGGGGRAEAETLTASTNKILNRLMVEQVDDFLLSVWRSAQQQINRMLIQIVIITCRKKICCYTLLVPGASFLWHKRNPWPQISPSRENNICRRGKENNVTTEMKMITFLFCLFLRICRLLLIRVSRTLTQCSLCLSPSEELLSLTLTSSSCVSAVQSGLWRRAVYTVMLLYASFSIF